MQFEHTEDGSVFPIREDGIHRIEVHVAGFCFRGRGTGLELLVAKRTGDRRLFPGLWECGGGQVRAGESFEQALRRQFDEEFGIAIAVLGLFATYEIHGPDGQLIPGLKFICTPRDTTSTGVIRLNPREHEESRWASKRRLDGLPFISGVRNEIDHAFLLAAEIIGASRMAPSRGQRRIGFRARKGRGA